MAITTVTTVTENGIEFGLSDPIDVLYARGDITVDKIAAFSSCGWSDLMVKRCHTQAASATTDMPVSITVIHSPWQTSLDAGNAYRPYYNNNVALDNYEMYGITFLVYGNDDTVNITNSNYSNYRIVTDCDYQKLYANGGSKTTGSNYNGTVINCTHTADGTPRTYTCMNPSGDSKLYSEVNDAQCNVQPISLIQYGNTFTLFKGFYFPGISNSGVHTPGWSVWQGMQNWYLALKNSNDYMQQSYKLNGGYNIRNIQQDSWLKTWGGATVETFLEPDDVNEYNAIYDLDDHTVMLMHRGTISWGTCDVTYNLAPKDWDTVLHEMAFCGVRFKVDNIMYKPIISGGVVTGYTDDPDVETEYDDITNVTGNNVPLHPIPPAPPSGSDDDNNDPIPVAGAPYSSGLARYYVTTAGSLILSHISTAMGAWNLKDSGKDLYKNIISCKLIKSPAPIPVSGSEPFTVYGVTLQYEGSDITLPVVNDNPTASFGSYNIPRKFNDFRDYAPYTKVEIYLPYCGWTVLPSHVVGRSVSVTYYTDIIAATCKAVVYCNSNVVAEAAGVIGLDIPMVTENAGAKAEAVTMGLLAYGKAGLQTALGVGAAVATKGKAGVKQAVSGLSDVVSAYSQTAMAFNQNYTEINGKNGDGCCIAGISAIVIKITRPKYGSNTTAPYVPSNYAHSTGYVSMKSATVGSFTGLLVAANVDTSGISGATEREKQLIKLYLESGIYVNHPS